MSDKFLTYRKQWKPSAWYKKHVQFDANAVNPYMSSPFDQRYLNEPGSIYEEGLFPPEEIELMDALSCLVDLERLMEEESIIQQVISIFGVKSSTEKSFLSLVADILKKINETPLYQAAFARIRTRKHISRQFRYSVFSIQKLLEGESLLCH